MLARSSIIRRLTYEGPQAFRDLSRFLSKACNEAMREANKHVFVNTAFGSQLLMQRESQLERGQRREWHDEDAMEMDDDTGNGQ